MNDKPIHEVRKGQHYLGMLSPTVGEEFVVVAVEPDRIDLKNIATGLIHCVTPSTLNIYYKRVWQYIPKSQRWHGKTGRKLGTHVFHTCPVGVWVIGRHSVDRADNANYPHVCRVAENLFVADYADGEGAVAVDPKTFTGWREIKTRKPKEVKK